MNNGRGQAAVEYVLVCAALALLGFLAFRLWSAALADFVRDVVQWRSGEAGMLP